MLKAVKVTTSKKSSEVFLSIKVGLGIKLSLDLGKTLILSKLPNLTYKLTTPK